MDNSKKNLKGIFDINGESGLHDTEKKDLYKGIIQEVRRKRTYRLIWQASGIAAMLVLGLVLFYMRTDQYQPMDIQVIARQNQGMFKAGDDMQIASLHVDKNTFGLRSLDENTVQENEKLSIRPDNKRQYSTLYVPYGRRQEVLLPDGSTVWLNAGSYLTFSHDMVHGDREVYLNGEGFFDVKHTGTRFTVRTLRANIDVLGTSFNASSYEDEEMFSIELLTGKVELNSPEKQFHTMGMKPGDRIAINTQRNTIRKTAGGTGDDILWTKKQLALKNVTMGELLKRMERIYNVKINAGKEVYNLNIGYSGRLNVGVDVVTSLSSIYELRNYDIILKEKEVSIIKRK